MLGFIAFYLACEKGIEDDFYVYISLLISFKLVTTLKKKGFKRNSYLKK